MKKDDMIMKMGIVHILDSVVGMPVLSDCPIDMGSNLCDFLKAHIEKFTESDDMKVCQFSDESEVMGLIQNCNTENFVQTSRALCEKLYGIMNSNIDIPAADVAVVVFSAEGVDYFGFLKLNYKTSYTHATKATETGENLNDIILQKAILPSAGQKLSEAFLVNLSNGEILLTEKKFEVNGEKKLYFSELFLECHAPMSQKTKLDIVTKAVNRSTKNTMEMRTPGERWKSSRRSMMSWRKRGAWRSKRSRRRFLRIVRRCRQTWRKSWKNITWKKKLSGPRARRRSKSSRSST